MRWAALFLLLGAFACGSPTDVDDVDTVRTDEAPAPSLPDTVRVVG